MCGFTLIWSFALCGFVSSHQHEETRVLKKVLTMMKKATSWPIIIPNSSKAVINLMNEYTIEISWMIGNYLVVIRITLLMRRTAFGI